MGGKSIQQDTMIPMAADDLERAVLDALASHTVLSMATWGGAEIHAVSLMYAHSGFDLYWLSDPKSHHSRHLENHNHCAVTIARQFDDFANIAGLQMYGRAGRLKNRAEADVGLVALSERYRFLQTAAGELAQHLGKAAVYRFSPEQITLIDNSRSFGFKQILHLSKA